MKLFWRSPSVFHFARIFTIIGVLAALLTPNEALHTAHAVTTTPGPHSGDTAWEWGKATADRTNKTVTWSYPNTATVGTAGVDTTVTMSVTNKASFADYTVFVGADGYNVWTGADAGYPVLPNYQWEMKPWPNTGNPVKGWTLADPLTSAYSPTSVYSAPGDGPYFWAQDTCPKNKFVLSDVGNVIDCRTLTGYKEPEITFTFSKPVTDWTMSMNNVGGMQVGSSSIGTMWPQWELQTPQTMTRLSGNPQWTVTSDGKTIKLKDPVRYVDTGSEGLGAGTVRLNGTYSTVTFKLHYSFLLTQADSIATTPPNGGSLNTASSGILPDAMTVQWSYGDPVPADPSVALEKSAPTAYGSTPILFTPKDTVTLTNGETVDAAAVNIAAVGSTAWGTKVIDGTKGTWSLSNGVVTFTPAKGFSGSSVVSYRILSSSGKWLTSTYTAKYTLVPRVINAGIQAASKSSNCRSVKRGGAEVASVNVDGVSTPVKNIAITKKGELDPPKTNKAAGLVTNYAGLDSATGTSVISWHVRFNKGCPGTLNPLTSKKVGETFTVTKAGGSAVKYKITSIVERKKGAYPAAWFDQSGAHRLLMITCGGLKKNKYTTVVAVFAEPVTS